MSATIEVLNPTNPKKILMIGSNSAVSKMTGWPIGVWAAELIHPWYEFTEHGYEVEIRTPDGGKIQFDSYSDPRDPSKYSRHDVLSMGFIHTEELMAQLDNTKSIDEVKLDEYDAIFVCGGQGPMYTFVGNQKLQKLFADFYEAGKVAATLCHGTCILLETKLSNGKLLVEGRTWTGFANVEEDFADQAAGVKIQPFRIEEEARKLSGTNYINEGLFRQFAVRDGNLITGQQQYSGVEAARLVIEALGQ